MTRLQKVLWTKGILLNPQHLQLQDGYLEDLLSFRMGSLQHAPWGFSSLEIDQEALTSGLFSLTSAAGIFPDGLPFSIPDADTHPAPRTLADHWRQDQRTMDVFLAVPEYRSGGHNVSVDPEVRHTRYIAEAVVRRDEITGLLEKPVQLARRNLRLLVQHETQEGYSLIPVARLVRSETGEVQLEPRFVPPILDLSASRYLLSIARGIVEILSARSSSLSAVRKQRNRALAHFDASDLAAFWLLYTVNTHLPVVRHIFEGRHAHPEALYEALLALGSALTSFSTELHPRDLPVYDHSDLRGSFERLDAIIRQLLETVVPRNHEVLPLVRTDSFIHAVAIDDDRLFGATQMYLGVKTSAAAEEVARRGPFLMKVGAAPEVERLIRHALPGLGTRYVPVTPGNVPVKLGYHYFELDRSGGQWDAVRAARNLAVYVPSDLPEAQLELVVMLPPSGATPAASTRR